jgi:formate dehydrogenase iron-sulfur subunit
MSANGQRTVTWLPEIRTRGLGNALSGDADPADLSGYPDHPPRMGFFTDTSVCIGCKACEVACKEWNHVPEDGLNLLGMSYDNTGGLGADTWRHVAFIEQRKPVAMQDAGVSHTGVALPPDGSGTPPQQAAMTPTTPGGAADQLRWLMASDVCKHCTHAACLDVCPTGALLRTEFGTVVVQEDVCNGCGYCIPACPYGVIDQRKGDGRAWKCTLCYDRISDGMVTTRDIPSMWRHVGAAAAVMAGGAVAAFAAAIFGGRR